MRKKSRKSKNEEAENSLSENNTNGSENVEANDENQRSESDEPEREPKRRKSDKRVSFSPKKAAKERDAKEKEPKEKESKSRESKEKDKEVDNGDIQYEVEAVLDEKTMKGVKHFLIRWKGYDSDGDTWEPEHTVNCPDLIKQFHTGRKSNKSDPNKLKKKRHEKRNKAKRDDKSEEEQDWDENEEFEIDRIIEVHHKRDGKREFYVSWKGYPPSQNSWVLEEHMTCNDLIVKFMSKVERAKEVDHKDLRVKRTHTDRFTLSTFDTGRRLSRRNIGKQREEERKTEARLPMCVRK